MTEKAPQVTAFTAKELDLIQRIARRDGITEDEAATNLAKTALARRVKKRTGKNPAKVYSIKGRK